MYHLQDSSHLKSFLSTRPDSFTHTHILGYYGPQPPVCFLLFFLSQYNPQVICQSDASFSRLLGLLISISRLSDYKTNTEQKHKLDKNETDLHLSGSLNFHSRRRLFGETIV